MSNIRFFGLLHFAPNEPGGGLGKYSFDYRMYVYAHNALLLAKSFDYYGVDFCLLTNDRQKTLEILGENAPLVKVQQIDFPIAIPSGVALYSSYHRLSVFHYLASLDPNQYSIYIDLDVVCLSAIPDWMLDLAKSQVATHFDTTWLHRELGDHKNGNMARFKGYMDQITGIDSEGRWLAGGGYQAGNAHFFQALLEKLQWVMPRYCALLEKDQSASYQGEVLPVAAALELMQREGLKMQDISQKLLWFFEPGVGGIYDPFEKGRQPCLVHFYTEKPFLAELAIEKVINRTVFMRRFFFHCFTKHVDLYCYQFWRQLISWLKEGLRSLLEKLFGIERLDKKWVRAKIADLRQKLPFN